MINMRDRADPVDPVGGERQEAVDAQERHCCAEAAGHDRRQARPGADDAGREEMSDRRTGDENAGTNGEHDHDDRGMSEATEHSGKPDRGPDGIDQPAPIAGSGVRTRCEGE
jgi:hypothetical protein